MHLCMSEHAIFSREIYDPTELRICAEFAFIIIVHLTKYRNISFTVPRSVFLALR